jgi:hypothetical protein
MYTKKLLKKIHTLERGQVNWTERDVHYQIPGSVVEQDSFIHSIYVSSQLTHTCTMVKKKPPFLRNPLPQLGELAPTLVPW